jgi:tRNA modification GTPase
VFSTADTIVAIATPPGRGGIGVVRLSGPEAHAIAQRVTRHRGAFEPRHATFTKVRLTAFAKAPAVKNPDATYKTSAAFAELDSVPYVGSGFSRTYPDAIDQAIVTFFPAPASYTGDDVVEISAHGSPVVLRAIVAAAIDAGARLAEPGEFTLRAFLNGRIDLMQAEAVADLIDAATPLQARAAFDQLEGTLTCTIREIDATLFAAIARLEASVDFPEEGYHFVEPEAIAREIDDVLAKTRTLLDEGRRGRLIREGVQVAIVGRPNVGKSSLFNALVGASRAIVTDVPGTTRDLVTEAIDLDGVRVTLVDTAGLRETTDAIEAEGVARSKQSTDVADLVLQVVVDDDPQTIDARQLIVQNKSDLLSPGVGADPRVGPGRTPFDSLVLSLSKDELAQDRRGSAPTRVSVSATTGAGLDDLRRAIVDELTDGSSAPLRDRPSITNVRHIALVQRAHDALERARAAASAAGGALSEEFVLADLQEARAALEEITGCRAPEELLAHIFERFCIGK